MKSRWCGARSGSPQYIELSFSHHRDHLSVPIFPPQKLPDAPEDVEGVSHSELERTRQLAEDNQVLRRQLEELRSSQREEVDQPRSGEMKVEGVSIQKQGKQVASSSEAVEALRKENESLVGENDSLKTQVKQLTQVGIYFLL